MHVVPLNETRKFPGGIRTNGCASVKVWSGRGEEQVGGCSEIIAAIAAIHALNILL